MNNTKQLANRLREVILHGTWISNTNFRNELTSLDWKSANISIRSLNSIALIARHIHYYIKGISNVFLNGELIIRDKYSFDFEAISSAIDWNNFLHSFWKDTELLAEHIENMSEEILHESFIKEEYGNYLRNLDGLIEHAYYHLGQIVLIKKLINENHI